MLGWFRKIWQRRREREADPKLPVQGVRSESLEPRVLFSADLPWAEADVSAADTFGQSYEQSVAPMVSATSSAAQTEQADHQNLVVIDPSLLSQLQMPASLVEAHYESAGFDVAVLQSTQNGISQLGALLSSSARIGSIDVLTTAQAQGINLGGESVSINDVLNSSSLISEWAGQLQADSTLNFQAVGLDQFLDSEHMADLLATLTGVNVELNAFSGVLPGTVAQPEQQTRREVVFVDIGVEAYQALVDDIRASGDADRTLEVILLDKDRDGVEQISEILQGYEDLDAIHIVAHGTDGAVQLGDGTLSSSTLGGYNAALRGWQTALSDDADLLIYGCDLASTELGEGLIRQVADLTGADVAASDDLTGAFELGGDWDLEFVEGEIETQLAFSESLQANWDHVLATTPESLVNQTTSGNQESNFYGGGSIVADADGNYVVVWQDNSSGTYDVYARLFNADGTPGSNEFLVNSTTLDDQRSASVAMDADGDFVVTWSSFNQDQSSTQGVYAQRFNASGVAQGSEFKVNTAVVGDQWRTKVGMDDAGNFAITFTDEQSTSGDVYLQRYSAAGTALGSNTQINSTTASSQSYADVAVDGVSGNIVVVWDSFGQDGDQAGVYTRLFDSSGTPLSSETQVNVITAGYQENAKVAFAPDGGFVVAWDNETDMSIRTFDASGAPVSGEIAVNSTTVGVQGFGDIAIDGDGRFVVAWSSDDGFGNYSIEAQLFAADGAKIGTELLISETATGYRGDVSVDFVGGTAAFSWSGEGAGDTDGVYARTMQFTDLVATSTSAGGLSINQDGGNDTYLLADDGSALLGGLTALTFETQFSTTDATNQALVSYTRAGNLDEFKLVIQSSGDLLIDVGTTQIITSAFDYRTLADGDPHSVAFTWDNTSGDWFVYVDGAEVDSGTGLATGQSIASGGTLVFGNEQDEPESGFDVNVAQSATLFDVRLFDTVRSASEVAASYKSDLPYDETGLLANWKFDNLSVNGVVTETVGGNNLLLKHTTEAGFTASNPTLNFSLDENSLNGTAVGQVSGVDAERDAQIASLLAADPDLRYNAETGKFYQVVGGTQFWSDARTAAEAATLNSVTGQLVTIRSAYENQYVTDLAASEIGYDVWIGATDSTVEGEWRWVDGGSENDLFWSGDENGYRVDGAYQNFAAGQPNDVGNNEDVARLDDSTGLWYDADHDVHDYYGYVIEWDADAVLDATQALTYNISTQSHLGAFTIDADSGQIIVADGTLLDYETNATHTLTVRTTDVDGNTYDEAFTVSLNDLAEANNAPTDLSSGIELNTDGGNDAYLIANDGEAILGGLNQVSLEAQFSLSAFSTGISSTVLSYYAGGDELSLLVSSTGRIGFEVDGNVAYTTDSVATELNHNYSVAATWDNTNGDIAIYLDGELVETFTGTQVGHTLASGGALVLGQEQDSLNGGFSAAVSFQGTLRDVRIWNEVRSEAEIALNYQNKFDSGSLPSGLVANWQMDGFNGSNEVVDVVSGNNLSIGHANDVTGWTNATTGVSVNGNTITFVDDGAPTGWLSQINSAAMSSFGLTDDYTVNFDVSQLAAAGSPSGMQAYTIGLSTTETDSSQGDVEYAMYFDSNILGGGAVRVQILGAETDYALNYSAGDSFTYHVDGTDIHFQHNGVTFHTASGLTGTEDWYVDTSFYANSSGSYSNQAEYSISNIRVDGNNGFIASTPVEDLHISENANNGDTVGFVVPSDPDVSNDIVSDGLFTEATDPGAFQSYAAPTTFGDWTVESGEIELLGSVFATSPLGGRSVDLNESSPGTISQTFAVEAGRQYQVVFALTGNHTGGESTKDVRASVDGQSSDFSHTNSANWSTSNPLWDHRSFTFTADDATAILSFQSLDSGVQGAIIADVQVIEIPAAVTAILNNDPTLSYDAATDKFYRFVNSPAYFNDALAAATGSDLGGVNGQLVTIHSQYENDLVRQHALDSGNGIWLGTVDTNNDGNWNWLSGEVESDEQFWTGGSAGGATNGFFAPTFGQSEQLGEDYARMNTDGNWADNDQPSFHAYIVEWDASEVLSNFTFSLTDDAGGRFAIDGTTGEVTVADGSLLDYETATTHNIDVQVADAAGNSYAETMSITININAVNDAPELNIAGAPTLNSITEDELNNNGDLVSDIILSAGVDLITDADSGDPEGIAIVNFSLGDNNWEYWIDGGSMWTPVGNISETEALLLRDTDRLRFVPDGENGEAAGFFIRAWDQSTGSAGDKVDVAAIGTGGSTAFSINADQVTISVTDVNDAPGGTDSTIDVTEDTAYTFANADFGFTDVDGDGLERVWIMTLPADGQLLYNGNPFVAGNWVDASEIDLGWLTYQPGQDGTGNGYASFDFQVQDDGGTANGGSNRDGTSNTITFDVTAENDAPILDLDTDDSAAGGADFATTWTEGSGPAVIADADAGLSDVDSANLTSLTVTITNLLDPANEFLSAVTTGTSITASYDAVTGVLSLTGSGDSVANFQQVLRTVTYDNTFDHPNETARTITFEANDGTDTSNIGTTTLDVVGTEEAGVTITAIGTQGVGEQVTVNVLPAEASATYLSQAVAIAPDGTAIVVWASDAGQDGDTGSIMGRLIDAQGNPIGTEFVVNSTGTGWQSDANVAVDDAGNFVVTWTSWGQDGDSGGVYAQRFNSSGVAQGSEFLVNTTTVGSQAYSSVAMADNGDFMIAWDGNGVGDTSGTFAQRFDANGVAQGGEFRINETTVDTQDQVEIASDGNGNFVATWTSRNQDGSGRGVYMHRFDSDGNSLGGEQLVNTFTGGDQWISSVAMNDSGEFVVGWRDDGQAGGIFIQMYNSDGTTNGGPIEVPSSPGIIANYPQVAIDDAGSVTVVWQDSGVDANDYAIVARQFDASGTPLGAQFLVNTHEQWVQEFPAISMNGDGQFVVVFTDYDVNDDTEYSVEMRRFGGATTEAGGTTNFSFALDTQPTDDVTITLSMPDGTEGTLSTTTLTFTNADWNVAQVVTVTGVEDAVADGNVTHVLVTSNASSSDVNYNGLEVRDVNVTNLDNDPALDLDADDSTGSTGTGLNTTWTEGAGAVAIADSDATLADFDSTNLTSLTVSITNLADGPNELLAADTTGTSIVATYDSATGILALTGSDTVANYQQVLRSVTYNNSHPTPVGGERIIEFVASDGVNVSPVATSTVSMMTDVGVIVVSNVSDTVNGDTTDIDSLLASSGGDGISLREALLAMNNTANTANGPDIIRFDVAGVGPHTINLTSALPTLTEAVVIDGATEPDFGGTPMVVLNGASAGTANGLTFGAGSGGSTVTGLVINQFTGSGIRVLAGSDGNTFTGNYIGLDVTGTADLGNGGAGILISSASNTIGGSSASDRNVISGNGSHGVEFDGASATNNLVLGNYIGTDALGTNAIGNTNVGVRIDNGATNNIIGGTSAAQRNVISGNAEDGIYITDAGTNGNQILGNFIGTDATGTAELANTDRGIQVEGGAANTLIGGSVAGAGNVISGNGNDGIMLSSGSSNTVIQGNFIGTDLSGTVDIGNGTWGVRFGPSSGNLIGGSTVGAGNTIAFNTQSGIAVADATAIGNSILGNAIYANDVIGIDINADGVTANDADDLDSGANNLQNYPVLTSVATNGVDQAVVSGSLNTAPNSTVRIEFFASASADGSGYGEAERYLDFVVVTADASGDIGFNAVLSALVANGESVTATATVIDDLGQVGVDDRLAYGDSSEFAQNRTAVQSGAPIIDLDDDNSVTSGTDFDATWSEGGGPVAITDTDAILLDFDSASLTALTVTITNQLDGLAELLVADTTGTAIVANYDAGTGVLSLTGSDSVANYQQVLRTVTYNNTSQDADTTSRLVSFQANDGTNLSSAVQTTVAMTVSNDAPTLVNNALTLSEGGTVVLGATELSATDPDNLGGSLIFNVSSVLGGQFEAVADPGVAITSFTQQQVTDSEIQFVHDGGEAAPSYNAAVSDGSLLTTLSAATISFTNVNDAPTGSVTIDNLSPSQGDTLTASNTLADADGLSGPISYQWQRDGVAISGATSDTYTTSQVDVGTAIMVVASYADDQGTAESVTSAATAAVVNVNDAVSGQPVITGTQTEDETLTADTSGIADEDGLGVFSYQWYRDGVAVSGATSGTYVLDDADVDTTLTVAVSYVDGYGAAESTTSNATSAIVNVNDAPTGGVTIDNLSPAQGDTLTATNSIADADGLSGPINYQWYRDGVAISGATGATYTTIQTDVGAALTTVASYTDDQGTLESVTSAATAAVTNVNDAVSGQPVILGTSTEDQTLTIDTSGISDADGLGTFSYQWYRDGVAISGETADSLVLGDPDVGANITVQVAYTDGQGTAETTTSAAVGPIANVNDTPAGSVLIDNVSPSQGDTLTASNTLSDADGLSGSISYQWYRDGVAISGATNASYVTDQADVGTAITTVASYTDDQGTPESVTSAATAAVVNVNDAVVGQPVVLGTTTEDQTLTIDTSGISDADGLGAFSYQWYRDGVAVAGASANSYVLDDADVGTNISVAVSYTDGYGAAESTTSNAVGLVANVNDTPTGSVTIDNLSPSEGDTLAASNTLADADGLSGSISYQWYRDGVVISGATSTTYTTVQADVGSAITTVASYTDDQGTPETVTSAATAAVVNVNDAVSGQPVITGTQIEDETLTADTSGIADEDDLGVFSYQWYRDGVAVSGAINGTYVLDDADVDSTLTVAVSYVDGYGTAESTTSNATGAIVNVNDDPTGGVAIDDLSPAQGDTLTATNSIADADGLSGPISYQWYRDGVAISGATNVTYVTGQADVGTAITTVASYTDDQGTPESVTSAATAGVTNVNDAVSGRPVVLGTTTEDQTLTIDTSGISDDDGLGTFSYQWYRDGVAVAGASANSYVLDDSDVGTNISVAVSYTDGYGAAESTTSDSVGLVANINDAPTGAVTIDNVSPSQGDTLTASNTLADADGLSGPISYQWYRDGVAISGATAATYTTSQADVGGAITTVASYTDDQGTPESVTSAATAAVANVNDAVVGQPVILGTTTEDQTLTIDTSGISDADGLGTFSYQWYRDGLAIGGATADSLVLGDGDVGANITVTVGYTDGQGTAETTTSAAVGPITNINDTPTGNVTIDNLSPSEDDTLTASNTLADADGLSGPISYQWYRDGVAISGATATTYTTSQTDVGTAITVVSSYTDDQGTAESVTSAATAAVVNVNDAVSGQPLIAGTQTEDETLTADTSSIADQDGIGVFSYQWYRDGVAVSGATNGSYVLNDADVDSTLTVGVSYVDGYGNPESTTSNATGSITNVNDDPTGGVTIDNLSPAQGDTLTATNSIADADGLSGPISYQWYRDGVALSGATAATYTTVQADVGGAISAIASYTDDQGTAESVASAATAAVTNVNDAVAGQPVVVGTTTEDQTLTIDTSGISDADGLGTFSYQWYRDGVVVAGASANSYVLDDADVGTNISVAVAYTDGYGAAESTTSNTVGVVANVNDAVVGQPVILGTPTEDQTLTIDTLGVSDADGLGTFSYQWFRDGVAIGGETAGSIILGDADVGSNISVELSYIDGYGTIESTTSAAVGPIANINDVPVVTPGLTFSLSENAALGSLVGQALASDVDALTTLGGWAIVAGNNAGAFTIDSASGEIWVADSSALDFEATPTFVLGVTVSDGTAISAVVNLSINLTDLNEAPVLVDDQLVTNEDTSFVINSVVLLANDSDPESTPLTLVSITQPDNGFVIDQLDGTWRYQPNADFHGVENITYTVSDGLNQSTAALQIVVTSVNDMPEVLTPNLIAIQEDVSSVVDISVLDADGDLLTFTLTGGADASAFEINSGTGALSFAQAPDYETPADADQDNVYELQVSVADGNGGQTVHALQVDLENVNETPWLTTANLTVNSDDSAVRLGQLNAVDPDTGDTLSFEITGGDPRQLFQLDASSGELSRSGAEVPIGRYALDVRVTDAAGLSSVATIELVITKSFESEVPIVDDTLPTTDTEEPQDDAPVGLDPRTQETLDESRASPAGITDGNQSQGSNDLPSGQKLPDSFVGEVPLSQSTSDAFDFAPVVLPVVDASDTNRPNAQLGQHVGLTLRLIMAETDNSAFDEVGTLADQFASLALPVSMELAGALDELAKAALADDEEVDLRVSGAVVGTMSLSAGFVVWMLRGGSLLASLLSSKPMWTEFDPLPVFADDTQEGDADHPFQK